MVYINQTQKPVISSQVKIKLLYKSIISIISILLLVVASQGAMDNIGMKNTEQGFKRALIIFGIARGLNGVISVAQGTEVSVEPAGIGLTFTPGEILDPVNDLIERFSWIMLVSGTSLGIQRVLLEMTSSETFTIIVCTATIFALILFWWGKPVTFLNRRIFYCLASTLIILRFCVPLTALCSEYVFNIFLESKYTTSMEQLEDTTVTLSEITKEEEKPSRKENTTIMEGIGKYLSEATNTFNIQARMDALKTAAENISEYTINLIVIFVIQTILIPLLFLWIIIKLLKWVFIYSFHQTDYIKQ